MAEIMTESMFRDELAQVRPIDSEIASLAASLRVDMALSDKGYSKPGTPNDMELGTIQQDEHIGSSMTVQRFMALSALKRFMALSALTTSIVASTAPFLLITGNLGTFWPADSLTRRFCCIGYWGRRVVLVAWNGDFYGRGSHSPYRGLIVRLIWSKIRWIMWKFIHHHWHDYRWGCAFN